MNNSNADDFKVTETARGRSCALRLRHRKLNPWIAVLKAYLGSIAAFVLLCPFSFFLSAFWSGDVRTSWRLFVGAPNETINSHAFKALFLGLAFVTTCLCLSWRVIGILTSIEFRLDRKSTFAALLMILIAIAVLALGRAFSVSVGGYFMPYCVTVLFLALLFIYSEYRFAIDEIRLDLESIRVVRHFGPFAWQTESVLRANVAELILARQGADTFGLLAEDEEGRTRTILRDYSRETLSGLAAELTQRWKTLAIDPDLKVSGAKKLRIRSDSLMPTEINDRLEAPRRTKMRLERLGDHGIRIRQPPIGIFRLIANSVVDLVALNLVLACFGLAFGVLEVQWNPVGVHWSPNPYLFQGVWLLCVGQTLFEKWKA